MGIVGLSVVPIVLTSAGLVYLIQYAAVVCDCLGRADRLAVEAFNAFHVAVDFLTSS